MKKVLKRVCIIATSIVCATTMSFHVYADNIDSAKGQLSTMEKQKKEMEEKIAALEKEKGNISTYIEKLDKETSQLEDKITTINGQIEETSALLDETKAELSQAEDTQQEQYEIMKARVKYMFENGNNDYMTMLLECSSLEDLLNKAEYISKISEYDQGLYSRYDTTRQDIEKKKSEVSANLTKLNDLKEELQIKKTGLDTMVANKQKELEKYEANIASNKTTVDAFEKEIEEQEKKVQALIDAERKRQEELRKQREAEKKRQEEERKKKEQQQQQNNSGNSSSGSGSDQGNSNNNEGDDTVSNGKISFRWPLSVSGTITSRFGYRSDPFTGKTSGHNGLDIAAPKGTPILAAASGTVIAAGYQSAMGNYVIVYHNESYSTIYMHASKLKVSVGQQVGKGQTIALVGSTGRSTGNHLHFTVKCNGSYVNPEKYVRRP